jgi:succinyl-diaminopimelate desuccinylase
MGGCAAFELDEELDALVGAWLDEHGDELVETVVRLVRFPSVSGPFAPEDAHPFGEDCGRLADASQEVVEGLGLAWRNLDYYAVAAELPANEPGRPAIALYGHLDVVPAGSAGWRHAPFEPQVEDGWISGRGTTDNKGPFAAVLFALRFLAEQGVGLRHNVVAYGGFNEEDGMYDVRHVVDVEPLPRFALVSDSGFPLCFAEKGLLQGTARVRLDDPALLELTAGQAHNAVADRGYALVAGLDGARHTVEAAGRAAHAAFPEGSLNAIPQLAAQLAQDGALAGRSREVFAAVARDWSGSDGAALDIAAHDEVCGDLTCVATTLRLADGELELGFDIRYPGATDARTVEERLAEHLAGDGFALAVGNASPPHVVDRDRPLVGALTQVVNTVLGCELEPYAMGGITHARWIPGAVGFGPSRRDRPKVPGRGGGHEANEAVLVDDLKQAVRVYVQAICYLDAHPELSEG